MQQRLGGFHVDHYTISIVKIRGKAELDAGYSQLQPKHVPFGTIALSLPALIPIPNRGVNKARRFLH